MKSPQVQRPGWRTKNVRNEALNKAVSLINEHFTEPLLITNLAAAVGYSVQHFQRLFLQEYGVTPHKYLQNLRLQRAMQMLTEDPERPVQDIALNLGMETNYFIRVFRKAHGVTPGGDAQPAAQEHRMTVRKRS
ncbi:helix-turn-helix transcriptional regulator [Paenibacillus rhizoplanae]